MPCKEFFSCYSAVGGELNETVWDVPFDIQGVADV